MMNPHKDCSEKPKKIGQASSKEPLEEAPPPVGELLDERMTSEVNEEAFRAWIIQSLGRLQQLLEQDLSRCLDFSLPDAKALLDFYQSIFHGTPSEKYLAEIVTWILARKILPLLPANPFEHAAGVVFFKEAAQLRSKKLITWTTWRLAECLDSHFSEAQNNFLTEEEDGSG